MKKILSNFLVIAACSVVVVSCKNSKDESAETPAVASSADSGIMTPAATDNTADNTLNAPKDTMTVDGATTAKPNPEKKGKKGSVSINAAETKAGGKEDDVDKEGYYTNVYPSYPGGEKALESFFEKNIQYPADASDNGVEGIVNINFAVDEKGKISSVKTTNPKIGYGVEEEAMRVFKMMPAWKPGSLKGKNVKTRYNLPVRFQLAS
ncbi:MAG: TonB family protein [Ferruginibacter sp.]